MDTFLHAYVLLENSAIFGPIFYIFFFQEWLAVTFQKNVKKWKIILKIAIMQITKTVLTY